MHYSGEIAERFVLSICRPSTHLFFTGSFEPAGNNETMYCRLTRSRRFLPLILGIITLASVLVLFVWDIIPTWFPARSHDVVAAFSLGMIAVAYVVYQLLHRPALPEFAKAILLAVAFLFWAANQLWSNLPQATLFNDIAIGLFVFDVFLVIAGWPPASSDVSFAETDADPRSEGGV